jgi:hypothetical protein
MIGQLDAEDQVEEFDGVVERQQAAVVQVRRESLMLRSGKVLVASPFTF